MRQTDLVLLYRGGSSSSGQGVAFPVVLRNTGVGTFWDIVLRTTHDGEETDRKVIARLGPQSETEKTLLLIPARFCDKGAPGVGLRPRGQAVAEALVDEEVLASVDLPGGTVEPEIDRVPRAPDEEATLLRVRPDGWEYLLFASVLRRRMDALEPKYRDHELRFARPAQGPRLIELDAVAFLSAAFGEARVLVDNLNRVLDKAAQERAFGPLGEPGDAVRIEHLGERLIDVYESLIDWAARLRGTPVDDEFERATELAGRFVDRPIQQFRDFVDRVMTEMDRLPALLRAAEPARLTLTLEVSIEEGLVEEFNAEQERLAGMYGLGAGWDE
jgi:hypothetical protein